MQTKEYILPNGKKAVFEYDICGIGKVTLECMDELMAMIADRPQGEWIPCEERLPRENIEVLMNLSWGIDIGEYREGGWHSEWINHYDDDSVIAWMPLPKPYGEREGE